MSNSIPDQNVKIITAFDKNDPVNQMLLKLELDASFVGVSVPEYLELRAKVLKRGLASR